MKRYHDIKLFDAEREDLDVYMEGILERRRIEEAEEAERAQAAFAVSGEPFSQNAEMEEAEME
jgi:hypothetical protein